MSRNRSQRAYGDLIPHSGPALCLCVLADLCGHSLRVFRTSVCGDAEGQLRHRIPGAFLIAMAPFSPVQPGHRVSCSKRLLILVAIPSRRPRTLCETSSCLRLSCTKCSLLRGFLASRAPLRALTRSHRRYHGEKRVCGITTTRYTLTWSRLWKLS